MEGNLEYIMVLFMEPPIEYIENYLDYSIDSFFEEMDKLDWEKRGSTPRYEYYTNLLNVPYIYGRGNGVRQYEPKEIPSFVDFLRNLLQSKMDVKFEVCFMNKYTELKEHLGWHSDDSPEMDNERPIVIYSLGASREIWFRPKGDKRPEMVYKKLLKSNSVLVMEPGMQLEWEHRIPKCDRECDTRISLTYRGYVEP